MSLFPEALIEQVRRALDVEAVVRLIGYRTETIQDSPDRLKCFCPIHRETIFRTLVIDKQAGTYRCGNFGCLGNAGGDLIDLYARARGMAYEQAALCLAEAFALPMDQALIDGYFATTLEVARNYLDLGALTEAEACLVSLVGIRPDDIAALEALTRVYERQERAEPLRQSRLQLARALEAAGQCDKAIESLRQCLLADPSDADSANLMMRALRQAGRDKDAATLAVSLADNLAMQGEIGRALEAYRAAQAMDADGVDAWGPMVQLLLQAGRREEAVAECLRQSEWLERAGDGEKAFNVLERAVELAPATEELCVRQARLVAASLLTGRSLDALCHRLEGLLAARAHGACSRALQALEDGGLADDSRVACLRADLEEAGGDADRALDLRLACVARLENARQFENALGVLERILTRNPANVALQSRKANLLRALGQVSQAIAVYLEIVDLFRNSDEMESAAGIYQTIIDLEPEEMEHRRRQLDLFLKLGPEPVIVQKTLEVVALCVERNQAPEASRLLERALEAAPESAELLWRSGCLYEQCGRRGEAAERFLATGQLLMAREDSQRSREAFERALRCVPEHLEAREGLANALFGQGQKLQALGILRDLARFSLRERDGVGAIRLCRRALEVDPDHAETLVMLAEAYEASGDMEQALATRMRVADLCLKAQDWGKATAICEEVLARHEDYLPAMERLVMVADATRQGENSIRGLWQLAQAHQRAGHVAEEQDALERILKNDPFHAGAWLRRLDVQARQATPRSLAALIERMCEHFEQAGRLQDGIEVLDGLIRDAESPRPEAFAGLARLCRAASDQAGLRKALRAQAETLGRMMRDGEALAAWDELAALEPDNHAILRMRVELMKRADMFEPLADEYRRLARSLTRTGHDRQAQVSLLEAIALRPLDVDAREELIELMIRRNDRVGARAQIEETAARLLEEEQGARAIALYERILVFDPEDAPTYHKIVAIYQRLDDLAGAMGAYERLLDVLEPRADGGVDFEQAALDALQLNPKHDRTRLRLAHFYAREGRRGEAETLLLTLAVSRMEAGALDDAEEALDQLLSLNPNSIPGRAQRAQLLARRGRTDDALKEFMSLTGQLAKNDSLQLLAQAAGGGVASLQGAGMRARASALPYEGIPLIMDYTFESFVIGEHNNFAHAAAVAACRAPGKNYNPLFLYADVGLGKTHLCHAIAHYVRDHAPEMKVRYVTMEEFVTSLIDAIGAGQIAAFRARQKTIDVLIVDDVQFLSGKEQAQEEFFHAFNALYQAGKQLVLTSDRPPKDIERLEKRLRSRFGAGIIVDIQSPGLETRVAILRQELAARGHQNAVEDDVLLYIAEQAQSNIRELKGALNQVLARLEINGEKLSLAVARKILEHALAEA